MDEEAFDNILDLAHDFFTAGYSEGLSDGKQVGIAEGKLFGIEKGYEKALEMGRLHGRALIWSARMSKADQNEGQKVPPDSTDLTGGSQSEEEGVVSLDDIFGKLEPLPRNARLQKHIDTLLSYTDGTELSAKNSDDAVAAFEEHLAKASAKAKIIATIMGEPLNINQVQNEDRGIEDADGLAARH